jgi:exonuclease SbcC
MNLQSAREKLGRKLADVSEVAAGVLRGVRRSGKRDVAAYVFDLNNHLPNTVGGLSSYLDDVMGPAYFDKDASPDLRWNNYLYFVVGRDVAGNPAFQVAKRNLEADRSYARKFVVVEEDFDRILDELDSIALVDKSVATADVVQAWSDGLSAIGLEDVLDVERPITDVIRSISSGTAKQSVRTKKTTGVEASQRLVESHITSINLSGFRPYPKRESFEGFGKANLLFGSNGVGKTSLLEGLEFLYCGANRRSSASASAAVEGLLASGHPVKTSEQQLLSDFKTRQRMWYGGDDNSRQNKLPNQFARFNFLNTDAAAELSLLKEDTKEGNAESLAALLSGHEATLMWRRIQDVRKAVVEEIRSRRSERAVAETDQKGKEQERLVLEAMPGQSDAAFSVFIKDLEHIGWQDAPDSKQAVTEDLVEALSDLTSQLSVIYKIDWLMEPVNADVIARQASALQSACEDVNSRLPATKEDERLRSVLVQRQSMAESRLAALVAISPSALAELQRLSTALQRANGELAQNARAFAALPEDTPPEGWESTVGSKSVLEVHSESRTTLRDIASRLDVAKQRLAVMASTQSQLQCAMDELHGWAQKVVEHRHTDSNCPVCGTEFVPGELFQRMRSLSLAPSDAAISELRLLIDQLTSQREQVSREASWLGQLDKFTSSVPGRNAPMTVRDAQQAVSSSIERQRTLIEARQTAQQGLDAYTRVGMSLDAVERLCMPVEGDERPRPASLDVGDARGRVEQFLQQLQEALDEVDERVLQRNEELRHRLGAVGIQSSGSFTSAIEQLMIRQRVAQRASEVCVIARRYLDLATTANMNSLLTSLEASVLGAKKVLAALYTDSSSTTRLTTLRVQLDRLSERINRIGGSIERLAAAQRALDDIIENQSLDAASAAVIAATHKVADSIFGRIHAPAEYLVTADAEAPLRRRANNMAVQLNQVSTGQRSAYALSMFLAMNAQVKAGPKVILLDDPISHIDDLNALSFLDYLRNLVLRSDRQVFFATADEKIAGLFVHKFGFLGDEFRTIELARG